VQIREIRALNLAAMMRAQDAIIITMNTTAVAVVTTKKLGCGITTALLSIFFL